MIGAAVDANMKQLEVSGADSAEALIAKHTGMDSAGWESQMANPDVAEVMSNPYAAAVVHKFRGRQASDELAQGLASAGVDLGDKAAVDAYYKENAPSVSGASKFFLAGYNEQNDRHHSQFVQQTISQNAADLAATTREAANTTFVEALSGPITAESTAAAFAALNDPSFKNIKPTERTQMQVDFAQKLVAEGRVEELKVFLSTKRGDAPALQDSAGVVDDAPAMITRAIRVAEGDAAAHDASLKLNIYKKIDDDSRPPMLLDTLESSPEFLAATEQGQLAMYSHWRTARNARRASADANATRNLTAALKAQDALANQTQMRSGLGFLVSGGDAQDALAGIRTDMFQGRTWDQMEGTQDAEMLKKYGVMLGQSGHTDDTLSRFLKGAGAYMTPETLKGNEGNLAKIFGVYQMLDPNSARLSVKDDKTQALLDEMDNISHGFPSRPVEQVATEAIARMNASGDSFKINSGDLKDAVAKTVITVKEKWLWDDTVPVDDNVISPYLRERTHEVWLVNGNDTAAALRTATNDAKTKAFAPVNGKPVRVPQGEGWTPERFSAGAEEHLRSLDPTGFADWNISALPHGAYRVSPPADYEGDAPLIVFERQLADAAATRGQRIADERNAEDATAMAARNAKKRAQAERRLNPTPLDLTGALNINP
jgi:hypothetical protein